MPGCKWCLHSRKRKLNSEASKYPSSLFMSKEQQRCQELKLKKLLGESIASTLGIIFSIDTIGLRCHRAWDTTQSSPCGLPLGTSYMTVCKMGKIFAQSVLRHCSSLITPKKQQRQTHYKQGLLALPLLTSRILLKTTSSSKSVSVGNGDSE